MSEMQRLRAAVTDGRTENIRYRQKQLQWLHAALRENAKAICSVLSNDTQSSPEEIEMEYYLTMTGIMELYDSIDFKRELKQEYLVKTGADNANRRIGVGLVVIRPTSHTRFYSVVSPLAAAIAAGNCIMLELGNTLLGIDKILKTTLLKALDPDTFAITNQPVPDQELETCFMVDQTGSLTQTPLANQILSSSQARTVAFVDRTANIDEAARAIVGARFNVGGTSPYAPDLVVVNEFVKQKFLEACTKHASQAFAVQSRSARSSSNAIAETQKAVKEAENRGQAHIFGSIGFQLVDVVHREARIATSKIAGRTLAVTSCTSLMDAVYSQKSETTLLAGYFFAEPAASKFLAQHLSPHVSFINHIPYHLLLGPAASTALAVSYPSRYTADAFSVSRPQYIQAVAGKYDTAAKVLDGTISKERMRSEATRPLKKLDQGPGHAIGFFEQGILFGAGVWLTVIIPIVGYGSWVLGRKGLEIAMKGK